mmetsp:Transcript_19619/g.52161  ORF Transcript_19619/g.52161 Transcript_19619/m.52161 type:complete len:286 (+) Transcript_19619:57-914(+)
MQTVVFDEEKGRFVLFGRNWVPCRRRDEACPHRRRHIFSSSSARFDGGYENADSPLEFLPPFPDRDHLYTNAVTPVPGVPGGYVGFPKRFTKLRHKISAHEKPGASDTVLIASSDLEKPWRQFGVSWVRPGRDKPNWSQRSNMMAPGIRAEENEWSLYISGHYMWDTSHVQRLTMRPYGFASMEARDRISSFETTRFKVSGVLKGNRVNLCLNYATSAAGHIQVQVLEAGTKKLLLQSEEIFGDELREPVEWTGSASFASAVDRELVLKFVMLDADIFAWTVCAG